MVLFKPAGLLTCLIPIASVLGVSQSGCGGGREEAYGEIASIYAEVLIAQLMYGDDSVRRAKIVDSIVNEGGIRIDRRSLRWYRNDYGR